MDASNKALQRKIKRFECSYHIAKQTANIHSEKFSKTGNPKHKQTYLNQAGKANYFLLALDNLKAQLAKGGDYAYA